jgi:hypothetical protein
MAENFSSLSTNGQSISRYLIAFLSGFIATLLFHQGVLSILHFVGFTTVAPFPLKAPPPFGLAQIWSLSFWEGV